MALAPLGMQEYIKIRIKCEWVIQFGDELASEWTKALPDGPVCVLLHGAIQDSSVCCFMLRLIIIFRPLKDSRSSTMKDLAKELASRGILTVCLDGRCGMRGRFGE